MKVLIELEETSAIEFKMWVQHMYDQQEDMVMSVEQVLKQL